ncbi:unnamed protein product [Miscanthus lutarioriparius]|uniref:Uncharacterized protein n=1 Tax=Miscanthus lutarioriparius TaxID=422564 RepID=A0A811R8C0_9POAL|nr:unnamed protein product [Miscanthus lutarioriparius]
MAGTATATISSLQSLLAHLWRAVCRDWGLAPHLETTYKLAIGCRARVKSIPQEYVGNAVVLDVAKSTVSDVLDKGLGWAAWLLNRAVLWRRLTRRRNHGFDVYGNGFGWGRPLAVRSGAGNKVDGKVTVYEGRAGGGSISGGATGKKNKCPGNRVWGKSEAPLALAPWVIFIRAMGGGNVPSDPPFGSQIYIQGTGLRMQSLVRNVCRAGSRGAAAWLLELAAAPVAAVQPGVAQPSSAVKHLRQRYGFARPTGVDQSVRVQSRALPAAAASGFGLCAKVLGATRGLSTVGNAAEVASDSDDSTSPAAEHPPRIKFKRPDKTARHIMNILNKEAVEKVRSEREIPDVQPGCMIQMRLLLAKHQRNQDLGQEESQESQAVLPEGQGERT